MRFALLWANPNNGNNPGPLTSGHREINWDGGNTANVTTTPAVNPFDGFLITRGAQFTTPGTRPFARRHHAGPSRRELFNNPTYGTIFSTFSPSRLFTPVGSNITEVYSSCPAARGNIPATVTWLRRGFHRR